MKLKSLFILWCLQLPYVVFATEQQPNVVVFFIDDLGWADVGVNGSTFYETPNIDALANQGANFTRAYSAHPVCSPSRAAMMSGKAPQRVGITDWIHQPSELHLPLAEVTIGEAFQQAGYKTGYIGKWHIGEKDQQMPKSQGFDWMKAVNRGGQPGSYFYPYKKPKGGFGKAEFLNIPDLEDGKVGDYLTDAVTDNALGFIEKNQKQPFLLYVSHYAVHTPIQAPADLIKKYQKKRKDLYQDSRTPYNQGRNNTYYRARQDLPAYAAMMENLDTNIGRVIKRLDELNLTDNTIVVFTSDNGGHGKKTSNQPLNNGKGFNYEGGIRIPTIISWPGQIKKLSSDLPIITMDMYPTLLDLAGIELKPKQHLDGMSIKTLLTGKKAAAKLKQRFLAWTYPHEHGSGHKPSSAISKDGWKLIKFKVGNPFELYNLTNDVGEQKDLAEQNPKKVKQLASLLAKWLEQTTPKTPKT
ncbi:sulfatase [Thalassotalea sp. ND16A]|uniref:sulfatase n=1 Tax=Thalassotalea sp. ND16A TaxID=1535422 RepID=UPI00051A8553|nr:sulfatase [Thalassotalea sp. ND16A]KGK00111.1 hypothetical protein ND16A_0302 [Thalassotalea sp. ND16A]